MPQKTRTKRISNGSRPKTQTQPQPPRIIEKHSSYASSTAFDGKHLIIDTQINDQPVDHQVFTFRELRKTNPLGASLVKEYLKGRIPKTLKRPAPEMLIPHIHINPVLPNLGLNGHQGRQVQAQGPVQAQAQAPGREDNGVRLEIRDNNGELAPINELPLLSNKNKFRRRKTRKMK
jgi:hypothetical protein